MWHKAYAILKIHSGMVRGVARRAAVAVSITHLNWFCKQLSQPTTDDIELEMCGHSPFTNEDTPLEIVEIYVQ